MAGASDKARFYLEQSIPELKEYERKKIFSSVCAPTTTLTLEETNSSQDEIASIARKRSDFEHKLNARGAQPSDYARYAEFEINVDSLRRKRVKGLRIKAATHNGQRRVLFILDRATRKFPGDMGLWMQQIEYARRQKTYKKLSQILTKALRLHPNKPDLWTYAAQFTIEEQADITEARSYMQRGLRFCKSSKPLWIEYMRLELFYVAKLNVRRQILGIDENSELRKRRTSADDRNADSVTLPQLTAEDVQPSGGSMDKVDEVALQNVAKTSALNGAIPIAIFDAAMVQFKNDDELAHHFFEAVQVVDSVPYMRRVLAHIADRMRELWPESWRALVCKVKVSCVGISVTSPEFPKAFRDALKTLQGASSEVRRHDGLVDATRAWLEAYLSNDSLDVALRQIMLSTLTQLQPVADLSILS
jgi:U3 small nucleolar RNA-associated protein 6